MISKIFGYGVGLLVRVLNLCREIIYIFPRFKYFEYFRKGRGTHRLNGVGRSMMHGVATTKRITLVHFPLGLPNL